MAHNAICKNKKTAVEILETVTGGMNDGIQKTALKAVSAWVQEYGVDIPENYKERQALVKKLQEEIGLMGCPRCGAMADEQQDSRKKHKVK